MGRTWVLIRGLAHERAHWWGFLDLLRTTFPADQFVPIDLQGAGIHHAELAALSVPELMEQARKDALEEMEGPFHLLAISLGGMVADCWSRTYPDEIAGQVIINSSFGSMNSMFKRMRWQVWWSFLKTLMPISAERREAIIMRMVSEVPSQWADTIRRRLDLAKLRPVKKQNIIRQAWAAARYSSSPDRPPVPTIILSSEGDLLCDPICSKQIAAAWEVPHRIHPWAGHDLPYDAPDWVAQHLKE